MTILTFRSLDRRSSCRDAIFSSALVLITPSTRITRCRSLQLQPFTAENQGIGGFTLPERAFDLLTVNQNVQVTETAILNPTMINETRFQFTHNRNEQTGSNSIPALDVSGSFGSGGSQVGQSVSERTSWELTNFTAKQHGTHAIKFGGRVRHISLDDTEGKLWRHLDFTGGFGLSSIERYQ